MNNVSFDNNVENAEDSRKTLNHGPKSRCLSPLEATHLHQKLLTQSLLNTVLPSFCYGDNLRVVENKSSPNIFLTQGQLPFVSSMIAGFKSKTMAYLSQSPRPSNIITCSMTLPQHTMFSTEDVVEHSLLPSSLTEDQLRKREEAIEQFKRSPPSQSELYSKVESSVSADGSKPPSRTLAVSGSRISTMQKAFDVFMLLDVDHDLMLSLEELQRGINMFDTAMQFAPEEVERIFRVADTTNSGRLHFAEFYAIFACLTLLKNKFGDETFVTQSQVQSALRDAGIDASPLQLQHMFADRHKPGEEPTDGALHIDFPALLGIYLRSPRSETELFLHSWYKSGRANFLQHRQHIEASPLQDFVAGTAAGVALTLVGHPFDTVKVRMQTAAQFRNAVDCVRQTIKKEGFLAVYKGMSSPMATIPVINAIVFACYGHARDMLLRLRGDPKRELNLLEISAAGAYAGLVNCVVACPIELIKTRLQVQYSRTGAFRGPFDCIMHILRASGPKGLFRGMAATVYREIPGYAGQFFTYEYCKRMFMRRGNREECELSAVELLTSGGMAGMGGWVVSYPMDFIKSQIQAEPWNRKSRFRKNPYLLDGGFVDALQKSVKRNGYGELWKGFGVCMLRAWPANAAGFLAYETVLSAMRGAGIFNGESKQL